jgi:hypothetical protein
MDVRGNKKRKKIEEREKEMGGKAMPCRRR